MVTEAIDTTPPMSEVKISQHADNRWGERTPTHATDVRSALEASHSVDHVVPKFERNGDVPDDVRLYHGVTSDNVEYAMLFIINHSVCVTTYAFDGTGDSRVDAYLEAMCEQTTVYE